MSTSPKLFPPEKIFSKIAGVTMGEQNRKGIPLRQLYIAKLEEKNIIGLRLVREPDNKFDTNVISIHSDYGNGDISIGYIQNRVRVCTNCSKEYPRVAPDVTTCTDCNGILAREGLASTLAPWMDKGFEFRAKVTNFTGGTNSKNRGCNILIELQAEAPTIPSEYYN